ncbi:MAG: FG-GAP repeat protein [Chloracidobacterium sp.]|nr:FG-GAP repeat protein [Chloracidobacterium sp.]
MGTVSQPFGHEKFGSAVDIDGDTAVVGSPSEHGVLGGSAPGVVYVFVRNGGSWTTQLRLFIPSPSNGSDFGGAVALDEDQPPHLAPPPPGPKLMADMKERHTSTLGKVQHGRSSLR